MVAIRIMVVHVTFSKEPLVCKEVEVMIEVMFVAEYATVSGAE